MIKGKIKEVVTANDFGVPAEWVDRAENYANWKVFQEREACAKVCDDNEEESNSRNVLDCAKAIRARSQTASALSNCQSEPTNG